MIKETFNLIILDRSGSMESIRDQAIAGVNETIGTIRSIANKNDMRQTITLSTFCGCTNHDIYHNEDIQKVSDISRKDYQPCCMTPLYDAIGRCCTRLEKEIGDRQDVAVSVTIITDGYENASREWTGSAVKKLIERLKEDGWLFAYIGANQDLDEIRYSMSIDNTMAFEATEEGTRSMFERERVARDKWSSSVSASHCSSRAALRNINNSYFDED